MRYLFDGLSRPVEFAGCEELAGPLADILCGWHFAPARLGGRPAIAVRRDGDGYRLTSNWRDEPVFDRTPASALCSLVVDLVKARIAEAGLLCLHCGAVEMGGRLVVFPSWYRAGKSTLCARLAAAGHRLFADDVLAIAPADMAAMSLGIAPRLRRPLPRAAGSTLRAFAGANQGPRDRRYLYLRLPGKRLAPLGTTAPVGAVVLLERHSSGGARLDEVSRAAALARLVGQNFGFPGSAEFVFERLAAMTEGLACLMLRYRDLDDAARVLEDHFDRHGAGDRQKRRVPAEPSCPPPARFEGALPPPRRCRAGDGRYRRAGAVVAHALDGARFLIDPRADTIFHLDPVAAALWEILEEPTSPGEAADLLAAAFPAADRRQVRHDVATLFSSLVASRLVERCRQRRARAAQSTGGSCISLGQETR